MIRQRNGLVGGMALLGGLVLSAVPVLAQPYSSEDLRTQILRMQRDMRDLQQEVYRNGGGPRPGQPAPLAPPVEAAPNAALTERVNDIEETMRRLTGELEQFTHQLDELSQKTDRLQRQLEFMESNQNFQAGGGPVDDRADIREPRATGNLGTLPLNNRAPIARASAEDEFDGAMNLLQRAQYDQAADAFRAFADAHPDSGLASDALYWTGDIAYSTRRDYAGAAREFAELLKEYPQAPRAPESMLKLGLSLLAMGQKLEGCSALAALPAKYPNASPTLINRARAERRTAACV
jgi:tol-pal system protein YbgF